MSPKIPTINKYLLLSINGGLTVVSSHANDELRRAAAEQLMLSTPKLVLGFADINEVATSVVNLATYKVNSSGTAVPMVTNEEGK